MPVACTLEVDSLEPLKDISGYGKHLFSDHIQGEEDSKGLVELGLVEVEKGTRGKSKKKITTLERLLKSGKQKP